MVQSICGRHAPSLETSLFDTGIIVVTSETYIHVSMFEFLKADFDLPLTIITSSLTTGLFLSRIIDRNKERLRSTEVGTENNKLTQI